MKETSVNPIGSVRASENGFYTRAINSDRSEAPVVRENTRSDSTKSTKVDAEKDLTSKPSNISIHFDVDDETNRVIVIVSERESGRVIRTIPASELQKMQAGDLLKMTA